MASRSGRGTASEVEEHRLAVALQPDVEHVGRRAAGPGRVAPREQGAAALSRADPTWLGRIITRRVPRVTGLHLGDARQCFPDLGAGRRPG